MQNSYAVLKLRTRSLSFSSSSDDRIKFLFAFQYCLLYFEMMRNIYCAYEFREYVIAFRWQRNEIYLIFSIISLLLSFSCLHS